MPLSNLSDDPDFQIDANLTDDLTMLLEKHKTSKLFIPIVSSLKFVNSKARRNLKNRLKTIEKLKEQTNYLNNPVQSENSTQREEPDSEQSIENDEETDEENVEEIAKEIQIQPKVGEYWTIKSKYCVIVNENPLSVQYFDDSVKELCHRLNTDVWPVYSKDLGEKISSPEIERISKSRTNFHFKK